MPAEIIVAVIGGPVVLSGVLLLTLPRLGRRAVAGRRAGRYTSNPGSSASSW